MPQRSFVFPSEVNDYWYQGKDQSIVGKAEEETGIEAKDERNRKLKCSVSLITVEIFPKPKQTNQQFHIYRK